MEGGWTNKTLSHTHCLSNLRTDHGTGRYGLAKDSDYASCAEMRKIRKTGFYMNFIDKIHNSFTSHDTPITQDTSSRLTLSLNKNTPSPDAITPRMPFITIRPNHHVKDIVGCARFAVPIYSFGASPWIRPLKEERVSVLCPCSQPVGYFSWRRAGFGLPNPPKPPDALAIGSDWAKGNAGPASHAPVAVFGEVRASSVGRETSREGGF